jgi:O-methyltransferase
VYSLDTFAGLPAPDNVLDNPYWRPGLYTGVVPLGPRLKRLAEEHGLDDTIVIKEGLFADTLPTLPVETRCCFAHLDSDLYTSVMDSLNGVYDRMVDGGILIFDDFFHHAQGPARAASDFFNKRGISPVYHVVFPYSVGIIKGDKTASRGSRSLDGNTYSFDWLYNDKLFRGVVEESIARCTPGTRQKQNAQRLLKVITTEEERPSNLYAYFSAMEDFWSSMAEGF